MMVATGGFGTIMGRLVSFAAVAVVVLTEFVVVSCVVVCSVCVTIVAATRVLVCCGVVTAVVPFVWFVVDAHSAAVAVTVVDIVSENRVLTIVVPLLSREDTVVASVVSVVDERSVPTAEVLVPWAVEVAVGVSTDTVGLVVGIKQSDTNVTKIAKTAARIPCHRLL